MSAKIFDVLLYFAATVVILAIIASATQAKRKYDKQLQDALLSDPSEPLIIEQSVRVRDSDAVFAVKSEGNSCTLGSETCLPASKSVPQERRQRKFGCRLRRLIRRK